jgi:hypothetical protein
MARFFKPQIPNGIDFDAGGAERAPGAQAVKPNLHYYATPTPSAKEPGRGLSIMDLCDGPQPLGSCQRRRRHGGVNEPRRHCDGRQQHPGVGPVAEHFRGLSLLINVNLVLNDALEVLVDQLAGCRDITPGSPGQ